MRILLLSPYPESILRILQSSGDEVTCVDHYIDRADSDFIVSYGYRHILKDPLISKFKGRVVNMHIAFLPWNRGADPNLWSWFDGTAKGVSIHLIDAGIDTGPLLAQEESKFTAEETLATSNAKLHSNAVNLFSSAWPDIRADRVTPRLQQGVGSFHRLKDKQSLMRDLPHGLDTPVSYVAEMGVRARKSEKKSR